MKKILCLFPAYEIITNKNSGGKIILCKDILRSHQEKTMKSPLLVNCGNERIMMF